VIVFLEGRLIAHIPLSCTIEIHGIGYEVLVPLTIDLPRCSETVRLWVHTVYHENCQTLYGFNHSEERDFFKLVIDKVSGVGPKMTLAMFSKFKLKELHHFIAHRDVAMLGSIPGIGKKKAEKIILELADKIGEGSSNTPIVMRSEQSDAILGLIALGYKKTEAEIIIGKIAENFPEATADQLIRKAITFH
jgi:Holliday junction DNA helicase RuvA